MDLKARVKMFMEDTGAKLQTDIVVCTILLFLFRAQFLRTL